MILDLMTFMGRMGARYTDEKFSRVYEYLLSMQRDGRLAVFEKEGELLGFATFTACYDPESFYDKGLWEYRDGDPTSKTVYVEMIIANIWNTQLRRKLEESIAERYPSYTHGAWHRPTADRDRIVIVRRRGHVSGKDSKE